jgi:hypothetical protein
VPTSALVRGIPSAWIGCYKDVPRDRCGKRAQTAGFRVLDRTAHRVHQGIAMRRFATLVSSMLVPGILSVAMASCSKREPLAQLRPMMPTVALPEAQPEQHGQGQGRNRETAVYVDGKPLGVMRYLELPASMTPMAVKAVDGLDIPRYYRLYDYVKALGVDVKKVSMVHLYGSHDRVAMIGGVELEKLKDRLVFDFTMQTGGKARCRWSTAGLRVGTHIDVIQTVTIYVDKPPPSYNDDEGTLEFTPGQPIEGIPYGIDQLVPKGTRVYVDGRLAGWVKRRTLSDKLIAPGSEKKNVRFALTAYLESLGVDWKSARAVDFIARDDVATRVAGTKLDDGTDWYFTMPRRNSGQALGHFPGDKLAKLSAIELYVKTAPPARTADPDVLDDAAGSAVTQNDDANAQGNGAAQSVNGNQASDDD